MKSDKRRGTNRPKPRPPVSGTVPPQLAQAFALFKAGKLDEAERAYLALVASHPTLAIAHNHLGLIAKTRGQIDRAEALLRRAVELDPSDISGPINLGNLLSKLGRHADADIFYARALEIAPDSEDCLLNRGWARYCLGDGRGALEFYNRTATKYPSSARAHNGVGLACAKLGRHAEAEAAYRRALTADPRFGGAFSNLGVLLKGLGRYEEACDAYRRALAIDPQSVEALNNFGCALQEMGRLEEAKSSLRRALELAPAYADAMGNLGNAHLAGLELDAAMAAYEQAGKIGPAKSDLGLNKSFVHLLRGEFTSGWEAYESRLSMPELADRFRGVSSPRWDGRRVDGQRLLILDEQGLGDTIQFLRFAPRAAERSAGRVTLRVSPTLRRLVPFWPGVEMVDDSRAYPDHDAWSPLLSLPRAMGVEINDLTAPTPYLTLPAGLAETWSQRIGTGGFKVGLVWAGSPGHRRDRERSIPPAMLEPLFRIPGLRLFSLQKVHAPGALETLGSFGPIVDLSADLADLAETGAAARAMDCVISVDTSVAHLAGALGVAVCTLVAYSPDWRWMLERTDSPWYPTMTLIRQSTPGDWQSAVARVASILAERAQAIGRA